MSSIDRTYHSETGNAAFPDSAGHDAGNESWNNFTVSVEVGGDEIEDWWLDLGAYSESISMILTQIVLMLTLHFFSAAPVLVPLEYGSDFNFDPEKHAIVRPGDEAHGSGEVPYEGYPASIEVMHKLHCLNFLRQAAYYNHQYYRSIHGKPWHLNEHELVRHIGHCVDIFR
ncbi:hypothetical protein HII31_04211 [Pseudocercospora fuligena]|uniref:Uncharacterized protein n=1 Tax=Pseudocercospora fuligena TaxID=685502 RepID=A0A8H6RQH7_9PEZI|nr:hypothetical protein HII31_04211 [Pseudocercospora fuligena]